MVVAGTYLIVCFLVDVLDVAFPCTRHTTLPRVGDRLVRCRFSRILYPQQDLMDLDLVAMASDVEAIADKATKEAHQETCLLQLEATWDQVEFCVTSNTNEMETPLVKISEEHLEVC